MPAARTARLPILLASLLLTSCEAGPTVAQIQAYLAVPGAGPANLLVDGVLRVGGISSPGRSGYQDTGQGTHQVALVDGSGSMLAAGSLRVDGGASVSLLVSGLRAGIPPVEMTLLLDDNSPPPAGQARMRVVHASAALSAVTLSATLRAEGSTAPAVAPVTAAFRSGTYFATVPGGRYRLVLEDATSGALVGDFPTGPLAAGSVVTALVSDPAPGSQAAATVGYFVDAP